MKLTDKSLEQFEKWAMKNLGDYYNEMIFENDFDECFNIEFWQLPNNMQYGVLVDFFDSVGIWIEILEDTENKWKGYINKVFKGVGYDSRPQARTKAIERANEIYNNR